ncbi:uncharacterized protein LOC121291272 [Carcharodon carcharias]|uniref:uncharacterized protein LOC121291272 n=1 Tax=Carcharodon carcharias TaxID=13397 RepID=UPI001B7E540C|nr:uncharacterized protein LOC121291272 [Carcharodon carcharias]
MYLEVSTDQRNTQRLHMIQKSGFQTFAARINQRVQKYDFGLTVFPDRLTVSSVRSEMTPLFIYSFTISGSFGIDAEKFAVIQKVLAIVAEEGQTVLLPCDYTANISKPIGSYSWYKGARNGTEVSNRTAVYRGRVYRTSMDFASTGDASIFIKDVGVNDSGVYYCEVVMFQLGVEYGAGTQLTVRRIDAEKFVVIQKVLAIVAEEGQTVLLSCDYTANISKPIGSYSWYKGARNGTEVSNRTAVYRGRVYRASMDFASTGDASIFIKDVGVNDSGVYYCEVVMLQLGVEYGAGTQLTVRSSVLVELNAAITANAKLHIVRGVIIIILIIAIFFWRIRVILWKFWTIERSRRSNIPWATMFRVKVEQDSFNLNDVEMHRVRGYSELNAQ